MKILKGILALIFAVVFISIPLILYFVRFNSKSGFGEYLKIKILKYPALIQLIQLNEPGDNRYTYLSPNNKVLTVNVYSVNKVLPDKKVKIWINDIVSKISGKDTFVSDTYNILYDGNLFSDDDLNSIRKKITEDEDAPPDLNIIYVNKYAVKPSSVGLVLHRDTIFIFKDAISDLSSKGYINDVLEKTTIMHEWGHLLGLDHLEADNCIMSEKVEVFDNPPIGKSPPLEYCWEELNNINILKKETL